jgi:hypothetical protein
MGTGKCVKCNAQGPTLGRYCYACVQQMLSNASTSYVNAKSYNSSAFTFIYCPVCTKTSVDTINGVCSNCGIAHTMCHTCNQCAAPANNGYCLNCSPRPAQSASHSNTCPICFHTIPPWNGNYCANCSPSFNPNPSSQKGAQVPFTPKQRYSNVPNNVLVLENGDTPDYIKMSWNAFSEGGKIIKALLDFSIDGSSKNFDSFRKCWFISTDVATAFIAGVQKLISHNRDLSLWYIDDRRVTLESFEEFFETPPSQGPQVKSKAELLSALEHILKSNNILVSIREDISISDLKPHYRRAALLLHPDRNNGDGSRMSELNAIWAQLQPILK